VDWCRLDHSPKGVSNAKLRAVIERPVFSVAPPRSGGTALQEVFDVALLPGVRYPEIAEEGSDAATNSFVLPEAQPAAG
jgi:hypothetical protein